MLPYKKRTKSNELLIFEILNKRANLDQKDKQHYFNLKKGYEGECQFDVILEEKLQCECLILNDLLFELNHTTFQIDSILIAQRKIHTYEIKNHEGDYCYKEDKLFKKTNMEMEMTNPLHQLSRSETLLRQLLLSTGTKLPIDPAVVFINPQFTLYQALMDKPIIFSSQMNRHIEKLNVTPSMLTDWHRKLADRLLALDIPDSPFKNIPAYNYSQLRKGITCMKCQSFSVVIEKRNAICQACGFKELVKSSIIRAADEFKILFPNQKVTANIIYDWCQVNRSKRAISNILQDHFTKTRERRWTYYT